MRAKLYYLDDEPLLVKQFERYMTRQGFEVRVFTDASDLIEACQEDRPDLLFLDYRLADTTGFEVAAAVDGSIKKVLVTGELSVEPPEGFCEVLSKPFRIKEAFELVAALLGDG